MAADGCTLPVWLRATAAISTERAVELLALAVRWERAAARKAGQGPLVFRGPQGQCARDGPKRKPPRRR